VGFCQFSSSATFVAMADKQRGFSTVTAAAAAAGICALGSSLNFALGGSAPQTSRQPALRGVVQQEPSANTGFGSLVLGLASAGSLAAVASVSKGARARTAVKAEAGIMLKNGSKDETGHGPLQGWGGDDRLITAEKRKQFALGLYGGDTWESPQFDPLCLSDRYPEHVAWWREAELKHGRVAMLAYVGLIVPDLFRIPVPALEDPDIDFVNAHNKLIGPGLGEGYMWYLLIACGILESIRFKQMGLAFENLTVDNAGDLGIQLFKPQTAEGWKSMKDKELKNGRLAMMAVSGALTGAVLWDQHHFPFTPGAAI